MPLILNTVDTGRPKQLSWDPTKPSEIEEINNKIEELKEKGYTVKMYLLSGTAILVPPQPKDSEFTFRILSENGDDLLVWDRNDVDQIKEAKKSFDDYLQKGYRAYRVKQLGGSKGSRIESFDDLLEEVIMQKGSEALLVPPTMPG